MTRVISLELSEFNVDFVRRFIADGEALRGLQKLINEHGMVETDFERGYPHLEPYIDCALSPKKVSQQSPVPLASLSSKIVDIVCDDAQVSRAA